MKPQKLLGAVSKLLLVALSVVTLTGAPLVQAAGLPNQITVRSQDIGNGILIVDSVTAAQNGWIVIYKEPNFTSGEIIGYAPVHMGTNTDVRVTINTARLKLSDQIYTLYVRLHADNGVPGLFEYGLRGWGYDDGPVSQNGADVTASFATAGSSTPVAATSTTASTIASSTPAVKANRIAISGSKDLNTGVIVVDSVDATQAGWLVIYKNPNFTDGEIVGYAPVHMGTNTDVKVTINTSRLLDGQVTLWARLHVDNGVPGLFEWGLRNLPYDDAPVAQNGQPVTAAFGISGL
jgi:hypothetical protein